MSEQAPSVGRPALAWALFGLTVLSTIWAGVAMSDDYARLAAARHLLGFDLETGPEWWTVRAIWVDGLAFSAALLAILVSHEMGHYVTARRYGVPVSPPYFIPAPMLPFGTLGAVIRMVERPMKARSLMRIAAFGPFAGAVVAVPLLLLGVGLSDVHPLPPDADAFATFGECLLMQAAIAVMGKVAPIGQDLWLHPVGVAAWAGLFVTGLNLIPLGQLDGGHVAYGLLGRRFNRVAPFLFVALVAMGALLWPGWLTLGVLVYVVIGVRHPSTVVDGVARGADRWIGIGAGLLFVLTFTPVPIS